MTSISPCRGCPLAIGCTRRDDLRKKVRGLGARAIRFGCDILGAEVRPGRRIVIRHLVAESCYSYDGGESVTYIKIEVKATILAVPKADYSFSSILDRGQTNGDADDEEGLPEQAINDRRFRRLQKPFRIVRFLDEPDGKICEFGNLMLPEGGCDRSSQRQYDKCCRSGGPSCANEAVGWTNYQGIKYCYD